MIKFQIFKGGLLDMTFNQLLQNTIELIKNIDENKAILIIAEHDLRLNKDIIVAWAEEMKRGVADELKEQATVENYAKGIACLQFNSIKIIPQILDHILYVINNNLCDAATKVSFIGAISYLVRENDIMDDNLPGGIGYIDDAYILISIVKQWLPLLKKINITEKDLVSYLNALSFAIPQDRFQQVQLEFNRIWHTYHTLRNTPSFMVEMILQQLLNNPQMLDTILNNSEYQNISIPQNPSITSGNSSSFLSGYTRLEQGGVSVSFPGGGGAVSTDSGIVILDN